ncbi:hypothetical protein [Persicimonas caeni]|uniref:hypothetical protein n=1 Tax=Persicimonas caeni TaxID=2292766 RepID=UPI0036F335F2
MPRAYLKRQGHNPGEFIGEVVWSGNHLQALRDLVAQKCDAAATYSGPSTSCTLACRSPPMRPWASRATN